MSPREMTWQAAIEKVLGDADAPLHYSEIAKRIIERELRQTIGRTPSSTVSAVLNEKRAIFERVAPATYRLRGADTSGGAKDEPAAGSPSTDPLSPIIAFGMFWERELVSWTGRPTILGSQQPGAEAVDMSGQTGIYLLHDFRETVYVGRAESTLGARLYAHTRDRLKTRWNRFSWFGFRPVREDGTLGAGGATYDQREVVIAMEALLIESLEPPQNRKGGDGFQGIEYIQAEDPEKAKERLINELQHLVNRAD